MSEIEGVCKNEEDFECFVQVLYTLICGKKRIENAEGCAMGTIRFVLIEYSRLIEKGVMKPLKYKDKEERKLARYLLRGVKGVNGMREAMKQQEREDNGKEEEGDD